MNDARTKVSRVAWHRPSRYRSAVPTWFCCSRDWIILPPKVSLFPCMFLCVHQQSSLSISIRVCRWPETVLSMSICVRPSWPETVSPRVCPGLCQCFTLSPAGRGSTHASQAGFFYVFLIKFLTVRRAGSVCTGVKRRGPNEGRHLVIDGSMREEPKVLWIHCPSSRASFIVVIRLRNLGSSRFGKVEFKQLRKF